MFRFCHTRWVEDRPVADRALEVWPSVLKVIKYWEGLYKSSRPSIKSYQVVLDHYTDKLIPCKFQFFSFIASIFEPYLRIFHTDFPMLPFMYEEFQKVFTKLLGLICKQDAIPNDKDFKKLDEKWLNEKQNFLDTHQMDIGAATQASAKDLQITSGKKQAFRAECRDVVVNIILKLVEKTPMRYSFVRSSTRLTPRNIANNKKSASKFKALADGLSHIKKIS